MKIISSDYFEKQNVFGKGGENTAFAKYFVGQVVFKSSDRQEFSPFAANVTFEPGCRNNWHIHHAKSGGGQMLICTAAQDLGIKAAKAKRRRSLFRARSW